MGELLTNRSDVLKQVFSQYDHHAKDELTPIQVQMLYGDLRMGSVSLPQVILKIETLLFKCTYKCAVKEDLPTHLKFLNICYSLSKYRKTST